MSKKLTVELTPTQARNLVWAINIWHESYEGTDWADAKFKKAQKSLDALFETAHEYASENGK